MKIAFDIFGMVISKGRGIGNYSAGLVRELIARHPEDEYYLFNLADEDFQLPGGIPHGAKVTVFHKYFGSNGQLIAADDEAVGDIFRKFIYENGIDVFYLTTAIEWGLSRACYRKEWFAGCRTIAIAYDIIPWLFPGQYLSRPGESKVYRERIDSLRWMDEIHALSQSVKDDLVSHLGFDASKIRVIYAGVDARFAVRRPAADEERRLRARHGISGDFLLCTGGDDYRKNLPRLISAYSRLPEALVAAYQLVVVCKLSKQRIDVLRSVAEEHGVGDRVVFTGFVSDEDLVSFYNLAALVVFPSLYEGFGLPVVEAWACGKPVLTSGNSSLGEIAADAAITVDPSSEDSIAEGLRHALTACDLADYARRGRERLALYQWSRVADLAFEGIRGLCEGRPSTTESGKRKLAFFTPLPPLPSGISDYSVVLLGALAEYYDIDVFIDDGYEPSVSLGEGIGIYNHGAFFARRGLYSNVVFQVGNSRFHQYMFDYVRKFHGVVVLHDFNLHGELYEYAVAGARDYAFYKYCLELDYPGDVALGQTEKIKVGKSLPWETKLEVNGFVANYADKIVVHSFDAKEKLLSRNLGHDVRQIWLPTPIGPAPSPERRAETRAKLGYGDGDFVFGVFGFGSATKRIIQILKAFSRLQSPGNPVKLLFAGQFSEEIAAAVEGVVAKYALSSRVKTMGFVPLSDFDDYICAADACLNLRKSSNGETSASLYRILAAGCVAIVNNSGSFTQIPSDICLKLPPAEGLTEDQEVLAISNAMRKCLGNPGWLKATGEKARSFAESMLTPAKAARAYRDFIEKPAFRNFTSNVVSAMVGALKNGDESERKDGPGKLCETIAWVKGD